MIVDAHSHMFHHSFIDYLSGIPNVWAKKKLAQAIEPAHNKPQVIDVGKRLKLLDKYNFDIQIVTPPHYLYSSFMPDDSVSRRSLARVLNDGMAKLMDNSKGRLIGVGTLPFLGFENGDREEFNRAIDTLGLKAITIPSNFKGKSLDSEEFELFWKEAEYKGIPIYIHPNDPVKYNDRRYESEYDLVHNFGWPFETMLILSRLVFSGIIERYPNLKIVSHHLGGGIPFFLGRTSETFHPSVQEKRIGRKLSQPLFTYFSRFYFDTAIGGSAAAVKCAYDVFGADHLLFATDDPFGPGTGECRLAEYPAIIESLELSTNDRNKILANNARSLFKL